MAKTQVVRIEKEAEGRLWQLWQAKDGTNQYFWVELAGTGKAGKVKTYPEGFVEGGRLLMRLKTAMHHPFGGEKLFTPDSSPDAGLFPEADFREAFEPYWEPPIEGPRVKELANLYGINLRHLTPTGEGGTVSAADVEAVRDAALAEEMRHLTGGGDSGGG